MEIKAKCVFDYKSMKALTFSTMYKRIPPKIAFNFTNITAVLLALLVLNMMLCFGIDTQSVYLLVLPAVIFLLNSYLYLIFPKIQYAALHQMKNVVNTYIFCDNVIKITSKGEMYEGEAELKYPMIPRIVENAEYMFIYQSKNQVFIVDKSTITNGTVDDLRKKLRSFVKKYTVLTY